MVAQTSTTKSRPSDASVEPEDPHSTPAWFLGTMGFSYSGWQGVFYPPDLPTRAYLAHYSTVFNAVEVDSTFYGVPRTSSVARWAAATPPGFRFCPKTPRTVTHEQRLAADVGAIDSMQEFLDAIGLLGDKLGPVLIQLPPSFGPSESSQLAAFLAALPPGFRYAVEFRDVAWHTEATIHLLRHHGIGWVVLDYLDLPKAVMITAGFLYVRWIGSHGRFPTQDREYIDVTPRLAWWWQEIQSRLPEVAEAYGFFNDDYAGHSPATCNRFKAIAGLPVHEPEIPEQPRLF